MSNASKRHPANNGKVMLTAWVDPALRDYVRSEAKRAGVPMSSLVESALRGMIGPHSDDGKRRAVLVLVCPEEP